MSIKTKILLPMVLLTIIVATAILVSDSVLFAEFVEDSAADRVDSAARVAANNLEFLKTETGTAALSMTGNPALIEAIAAEDRSALLLLGKQALDKTGLEFCTITDASGRVILRTHAPEIHGDSIAAQFNIASALAGESATVIEAGSLIPLAIRSSTPVFTQRGQIVGAVSLGYRLDTDWFVDEVKHLTGCEATVFLGTDRISTTVLQNGVRAIGTKADAHMSKAVLAGDSYTGKADILGRTAVAHTFPLFGPNARAIGMIYVGQYVDDAAKNTWAFVKSTMLITGIMLALATLLILFITRRIVAPILAMTRAASALAAGDTDIDIRVNTKDEMRTLADAFNRMLVNIRQQVDTIQRIAAGDAAISLRERSEKDLVNRALGKLHETIQAQAAVIREEHKRVKVMLDSTPLSVRLWSRDMELIDCNEAAIKMFNIACKREYIERYYDLSPEFQPDGQTTRAKGKAIGARAARSRCPRPRGRSKRAQAPRPYRRRAGRGKSRPWR